MRYLKIPKERIAVLIGEKGKTRRRIESFSGVKLDIDSSEGEVVLNIESAKDAYLALKAEETVKAIARGFSPQHAERIFSEDAEFFLFDIHDYVGKRQNHVHRVKSRVIGREGKTKRVIETLTGANLVVYGHTVGLICDMEAMDIAKTAVDMILSGSRQATVYRYLEREMKQLRHQSSQQVF